MFDRRWSVLWAWLFLEYKVTATLGQWLDYLGAFSLKGVGHLSRKTLLEWLAGPCSSSTSLTRSKGNRGEVDTERQSCLPSLLSAPCELSEEAEVFGKCTFNVSAGPWLHRQLSHGVSSGSGPAISTTGIHDAPSFSPHSWLHTSHATFPPWNAQTWLCTLHLNVLPPL